MCGIIGYIGERQAAPLLLEGIRRLEYRGYDSVGGATISDGKIYIKKDKGKIEEVDSKLKLADLPGNVGIYHTRWATHGAPSRANAHPHLDNSGRIAVVHNGIIENYLDLRRLLQSRGYTFSSETDTEVIPNLISYHMRSGWDFEEAVRKAVKQLRGSYALGIICADEPDKLIGVRKESPLIIGLGKGENFLASDIPALLPFTKRVIVLEDDEMVVLTGEGFAVRRLPSGAPVKKKVMRVTWTPSMAEKGGYPHFTLKEIYEQPDAVRETLRAKARELERLGRLISRAKHIYLVGCGTSYHAGLVGKYVLSRLAGISVEAVISSEFQESCRADEGSLIFAITQSGETADTLKAVRIAKAAGARVACLTNVVGSSITRESDLVCYTHAGPEVSVVATKTFSAQVTYLSLLSIHLAQNEGRLSRKETASLRSELFRIPDILRKSFPRVEPVVKRLAKKYCQSQHFYLIGRGIGYPVAMEGALKIKEISYIHAEAMPGGELKHGTLALIEKGTPVIAIVPRGEARSRMVGNIEEIKARGATILALAEEGDEVKEHVDELIPMQPVREILSPLPYILPLQLLAYYMSVERGHDPDRPRALAKSVTVE
ncbi:MAG: glutamine--fructose-6-phosphate transaminase (isomerizing) [Candidatus Hadarchaeales archaeon]